MTLYIYGLDPAEKNDAFGIVVHAVDNNQARLKTLRKLRNVPYPDAYRILQQDLFSKYPPYQIVIDYSNEKTFSEILIEKFGKERVEPINFTTANKLMLKQDGLKILQMGYVWPTSQNEQVQAWIQELRDQLKHEQMIETPARKITFDHPEGEHNDLAIAWELSVHGSLRFISRDTGPAIVMSASSDSGYYERAKSPQDKVLDSIPFQDMIKRIRGGGADISDVQVNGESVNMEDPSDGY